jgi:hypothetical protein
MGTVAFPVLLFDKLPLWRQTNSMVVVLVPVFFLRDVGQIMSYPECSVGK